MKCQKEKAKTRQYSVKMGKQFSDHDYTKCEVLLQIRPGLRNKGGKNTKKTELNVTDESTDEDPAEKQDLDNLILFSDDDPDNTFLAETINSALENENAVNINLLDTENSYEVENMTNKINDFDEDADEECDNEGGEESSTDDSIFPPFGPPTQT